MAESIVMQKSFAFSLKILVLTHKLQSQHQYALANQLFRSGTGIGSNVEEASAGVSRDDFRVKLGIAAKEARETRYWLRLMKESGIYHIDVSGELNNAEELVRILTSIMKTLDEEKERQRQQKTTQNLKTKNPDVIRETENVTQPVKKQQITQNSKLKTQNLNPPPLSPQDGGKLHD